MQKKYSYPSLSCLSWLVPPPAQWPFVRLLGVQEPASVVFSVLNAAAHVTMVTKFRRRVSAASPMYYIWHCYALVSDGGTTPWWPSGVLRLALLCPGEWRQNHTAGSGECRLNLVLYCQSLLLISPVTRRAATWPLVLELIFFRSNNVRMSKATEMCLRDHNSNNCTGTYSGNVCYCMYMVNNDFDKFRSFSRLYMTLFQHRTSTYLHGRADRFLVSVSNGQVAALSDWAYYQ